MPNNSRHAIEYVVSLHSGKDGDDARWETVLTTTRRPVAERRARLVAQQNKGRQVLLESFTWDGFRRFEPETFQVFPATRTGA